MNFSPSYLEKIQESLSNFIKNGDDVVCIGYYTYEYGTCDMCSHHPIKWHYILENLQSQELLIVGSECIENYQIMLKHWGYTPESIVFPTGLKTYSTWILKNNPNAVIYENSIVMRFKSDCQKIINDVTDEKKIQSYKYVIKKVFNGSEKIAYKERSYSHTNQAEIDLDIDLFLDKFFTR